MQTDANATNRNALVSAVHSKSYDPSAPYRALLNPTPPPAQVVPPQVQLANIPLTNMDPNSGVLKRIPQFYYPRYNEPDIPEPVQSNTNPVEIIQQQPPPQQQQPIIVQQPNPIDPYGYSQGFPMQMDPYGGVNPYYPYGTPILIPLPSNGQALDPTIRPNQEQSKSEAISAHQKDADLSRLEVYHFVPKNNSSHPAAPTGQPIIQYHVYPQAPSQMPFQRPQLPLPQQQQHPSNFQPWYVNPANNTPPTVPEPPAETKARGSQTESPEMKNRAISPIQINPTIPPVYDEDGYPYIHYKTVPTERYYVPTRRIDRRFYDANRSTPLADCRCLDCQRERSKTLNYYPD